MDHRDKSPIFPFLSDDDMIQRAAEEAEIRRQEESDAAEDQERDDYDRHFDYDDGTERVR